MSDNEEFHNSNEYLEHKDESSDMESDEFLEAKEDHDEDEDEIEEIQPEPILRYNLRNGNRRVIIPEHQHVDEDIEDMEDMEPFEGQYDHLGPAFQRHLFDMLRANMPHFYHQPHPQQQQEDEEMDLGNVLNDDEIMIATDEFNVNFEEKFGPIHPQFYTGTLEDAKLTARQTGKFLFIYLHESVDGNSESDLFCEQVLCSDTVSQLLTENFIVWAWDVSKPNHLNTLRKLLSKHITTNVNFFLPKKFPFIGILASIRGSLTLLDSSEGFIPIEDMVHKLLSTIETHNAILEEEVRRERDRQQERDDRDRLIKEQEQAYLDSLDQDLQKEKEKIEQQKAQEEAERKEKEEQILEQERLNKLRETIPEEPNKDSQEETSSLLFRLPDGRRLQRRFLATTPLKVIFDYLTLENYSKEKGFEVLTNYPKRKLNDLNQEMTLKEAQLFPQETLFVQAS